MGNDGDADSAGQMVMVSSLLHDLSRCYKSEDNSLNRFVEKHGNYEQCIDGNIYSKGIFQHN